MATQTIEIRSEYPGEANTVCRARNPSSGVLVQSSAALAAPDASGVRYFPQFTDLPAGEYLFVLESSGGDELTYGWATVTLTTATFVLQGVPAAELPALASTAVAILEDTGTTLPAQIAGISSGAGSGARTVTVTVNDGTDTLQNATVRMSEGVNTYTALTNASGVAVFNLDDATYVVGVSKSGYTFAGSSLVVDGAETVTYSMTQVSVSPPDDPALCAVTIPIVNQHGVALVGETVEIRFNQFADSATTTTLVLSPPPTQTSDANGYVSVNLLRLASYSVFYGASPYQRRVDIDVPDLDSFVVGE